MICQVFLSIVLMTVLFNLNLFSFEMLSPDLFDTVPLDEFELKERQSKAEKLFKASFREERLQQDEAIEHIRKTMSFEKQYKLTYQLFEKLFYALEESKSLLEHSDYVPALDFPTNQPVIGALSQVLVTTALYVEFQLKIPDITDQIMKNHNEWMILIKWAIGFSNSTRLYDPTTSFMISLAAQDMNLIARPQHYSNPYRMSDQISKAAVSSKQKNTPQKKKKKFQRGPRMSRHTEL